MAFDAAAVERSEQLRLVTFNADAAFEIGSRLRNHIRSHFPSKPAIIDIRAVADDQQYFFAVCAEGSQPDNKYWAERKRRSVVRYARPPLLLRIFRAMRLTCACGRWGKSTASLRLKWPQGIPSYFAASEDDVRPLFSSSAESGGRTDYRRLRSTLSTAVASPSACRASSRSSARSS